MIFWIIVFFSVFIGLLGLTIYKTYNKSQSSQEFMLAKKNIGVIIGFLTFSATLFSAFTFQGMPDFFRKHGVGAWFFLAFSDAVMVFFILYFGSALRKKARTMNFKGVAGMMSKIYRNKWAGRLLFLSSFLFLIPYASIQIRGISIFLDAAFPQFLPWWGWSLILIIVMLTYSQVGGFKAIVYADAIQGIILLTVIWIIALRCIELSGGIQNLFNEVFIANAKLLSVPGPNGLFSKQFLIASLISIVLIPVTQPQLTTRLIIMRDLDTMKRMSFAVGLFAMVIILATLFIGMYGAVYYPEADTTTFLSNALLFDQLDMIAGMAVVGLFAAAFSTTNAQIFAMGNELRSLLKTSSEKKSMVITRVSILVFALMVLVFSSIMSNKLVLLARVSFIGTSTMGPIVLIAIYSKKTPGLAPFVFSLSALITIILSVLGILPESIFRIRLEIIVYLIMGLFIILYLTKDNMNIKYWKGKDAS